MRRIANFSIYVAENKINKDFLLEIITSLLNEDDFSEQLKIKIVNRLFN
jgi:death-on-curing protein